MFLIEFHKAKTDVSINPSKCYMHDTSSPLLRRMTMLWHSKRVNKTEIKMRKRQDTNNGAATMGLHEVHLSNRPMERPNDAMPE